MSPVSPVLSLQVWVLMEMKKMRWRKKVSEVEKSEHTTKSCFYFSVITTSVCIWTQKALLNSRHCFSQMKMKLVLCLLLCSAAGLIYGPVFICVCVMIQTSPSLHTSLFTFLKMNE